MREICSFARSDLAPELRLILACLRVTPDEKEAQQIGRTCQAEISWPDFLEWVDRHRVAPLVYTNLSRYAGKTVPSAIMGALRSRFEGNARRGLANAAESVRLCKLFQENAISVLPLKGSVLALQVYGNLALRHAGDIDLLVESNQLELAHLLLQTSYRRIGTDFWLTPSKRQRFLRLFHHFEYADDRSNLRLELHWRPIYHQPAHAMKLTRLRSQASTVAVAGYSLPAMSLPDNFLYLCAHGAVHSWYRLFWLVDLAEIMRRTPGIDWQHLMTLARKAGMMRPLAQGVILAHELLDVPLPEVIRTYALQDRMVSCSTQIAHRFILCSQPEKPPISLLLDRYICNLRCANSFKEKLKTFQEICLGQDWRGLSLPDSLFFLYYFLRFPLWLQRRRRGSRKRIV
ncbi:MAG: nucleotidyltransferase domain-containing protein [Desulfobaccales bacterium]